MTNATGTYRGTRTYQLVYCRLLGAARAQSLVSYTEVADLLGTIGADQHLTHDIGRVLGEISEDEHAAGRPLLSAVVVTGKGIPGDAFFVLARRLDRLATSAPAAEMTFWMDETRRLYDAWASATATA